MKVVVVGAGHAGGSVASLLKASGFEGEIVLIGDEPVAPLSAPTPDRNDTSKATLHRADDDRSGQVDMDGEDRTGRPRRFPRFGRHDVALSKTDRRPVAQTYDN